VSCAWDRLFALIFVNVVRPDTDGRAGSSPLSPNVFRRTPRLRLPKLATAIQWRSPGTAKALGSRVWASAFRPPDFVAAKRSGAQPSATGGDLVVTGGLYQKRYQPETQFVGVKNGDVEMDPVSANRTSSHIMSHLDSVMTSEPPDIRRLPRSVFRPTLQTVTKLKDRRNVAESRSVGFLL